MKGRFASTTTLFLLGCCVEAPLFAFASTVTLSSPEVLFHDGSQLVTAVVAGDINGDGVADIAFSGSMPGFPVGFGAATVLVNSTDAFASPITVSQTPSYAAGLGLGQLIVADVDGDGRLDLIGADQYNAQVRVALNTTATHSTPTFAPWQVFSIGSTGNPTAIAFADMNGDGMADIAFANANGEIGVLLNQTLALATQAFSPAIHVSSVARPSDIAVADLNRDGRPDLVVADTANANVAVLFNSSTSASTLGFAVQKTFATGAGPTSIAVRDVNRDDRPDLIVANGVAGSVSVLLNTTAALQNAASFAAKQDFSVGAGSSSVAVADVDNDGMPDLIVANATDNTVSILTNLNSPNSAVASFSAPTAFASASSATPSSGATSVTTADLNGDGKVDVIVGNGLGIISAMLNTTVSPPFDVDQHGITGSWYNPATSGQGFEIELYPDLVGSGHGVVFSGWFTYDVTATGGQRWYAMQGTTNGSPSIPMVIATATGGAFNSHPAANAIVGSGTLHFDDCSTGEFDYMFSDGSGRSGSIPLSRLTANVTCATNGDNADNGGNYLLSGSWYDQNVSGQGLIFDFNPPQTFLFATWYTFAPEAAPSAAGQRWYTLQKGDVVAVGTSIDDVGIYSTADGVFDAAQLPATERVGTAKVMVKSCNAMQLDYTFTSGINMGLAGTINLQRTGPAPQGCHL